MRRLRSWFRSRMPQCMLFVALCFGLTSAVYLTWLDRAVTLAGARTADWGSMVAGYLLQAAGMGAVFLWLRKRTAADHTRAFLAAVVLFTAVSVPALSTGSAAGVLIFGGIMNVLCGVIAGFYLYAVARQSPEDRKSHVFGGGYALATAAVGLLALIGNGSLIHGPYALALYVPLAAGLCLFSRRSGLLHFTETEAAPGENVSSAPAAPKMKTIFLAGGAVLLISVIKNLGFGFPSSDIEAGLIPELSRLPYAAGLIAAGIIMDRDRHHGMLCTLSALILPFLMLGLMGEPVSSTIFWGLDYIFFAFFSVYRAVLFFDLARRTGRRELALPGLLLGRAGDALGTAVNLLLSGQKIVLIGVSAVLFLPAVFLLFRVHREVYEPETGEEKREEEIFQKFCEAHDFSNREREIFRLLIGNKTNGMIAEQLFITENTVKYHVRNVLQKSGCKNRTELQQMYADALHPAEVPKTTSRPTLRLHA